MNVVILTEGGKNRGFGHIARCSSIYSSLKEFGISPMFIVNGDESVDGFITDFDFLNFDWIANQDRLFDMLDEDDIVIIDSYLADKVFYDRIADEVSLGVYLDDNNRLEYPEGILLNGTILASRIGYSDIEGREDLLGSEFILLRKPFEEFENSEINREVETVLITMGGDDFRNLTPEILELLDSDLKKKVIVGNSFKNVEKIREAADSNTEILFNLDASEMLDVMLSCDLAISSSGQTLYELARVGVPTIAIGIVDNQINNIENWQEQGFIEFVGFWDDDDLLENIKGKLDLLNDYGMRQSKREKGNSAVDGKGARRLVKRILSAYYKKNLQLRKADVGDCYRIFEIANDDEVRKASFNSEKIPLENHRKWFENIIDDEDTIFLVAEYEDDLIGQVRFDLEDDGAIVSISLNKKYRGLNISRFLLLEASRFAGLDNMVAYIKKENRASISLFERCGFEFEGTENVKGFDALKYVRSL